MFEYDQDVLNELLKRDERFRKLYREHADLKMQVREAEIGVRPLDDLTVSRLKKRRLLAKDKMAHIIQKCRGEIL